MPLMFGPGVLATILGWSSMGAPSHHRVFLPGEHISGRPRRHVTYLVLAYAQELLGRIGPRGIDAATCGIVGFFVSAIGMGLVFHGILEAWQNYKTILGS